MFLVQTKKAKKTDSTKPVLAKSVSISPSTQGTHTHTYNEGGYVDGLENF